MNEGKIAVRYAKALFQLAVEHNALEQIRQDFELMSKVYELTPEFSIFLANPSLSKDDRLQWLQKLIPQGNVLSIAFLKLLVAQRRDDKLPSILRYFLSLCRQKAGIKQVVVTTAVPLSEQTLGSLTAKLETKLNAKVELETQTDESIIGGIILQVDDMQFDASVASELVRLKNQLLSSVQV
jgi:F-type H+-transporting ATPase subunit delta